ncbi:GTPase domain-containing protein [Paraburkholderia mimosarum]|uniref:GTPase domain-containing protein n=1 Tax=Paraburkholderia mimosarum TaxID=312026 RepID=UPI000423BCDE|nr:GTPase domain-containing protein [Paraburkholderia mimosarum]
MANELTSKNDNQNDQTDIAAQDADWARILVACQVGRTGKSTVSDSVLANRLNGRIFSVESVNQDASQYGAKVRVYRANDMMRLRVDMATAEHPVIVDLGASDFAVFLDKMDAANLFMDFSHCVIVADPTQRGQEEAITTYDTLRRLGIDNSKFRFVLNKAHTGTKLPVQFDILFAHAQSNPDFPINQDCWLPENDLFRGLHQNGQGYREVLADKTDYKALIRKALNDGDKARATDYAMRQTTQRMALGMQEHFDRCFNALGISATL